MAAEQTAESENMFRRVENELFALRFGTESATLNCRQGFIFLHEVLARAGEEVPYDMLMALVSKPEPKVATREPEAVVDEMTSEQEGSATERIRSLSQRADDAKEHGDGKLADSLEVERALIQRQMQNAGLGLPRSRTKTSKMIANKPRVQSAIKGAIDSLRKNSLPLLAFHLEKNVVLAENAVRYHPIEPAIAWAL